MKERLVFAAVADDDTGASDLAGALADQNLRTLLVIDLPSKEQFLEWCDGYDAVVMAEGTRNLSVAEAQERTRRAIRLLEAKRPRVFQIKYCSTFDSTTVGNIGPSIDAALDELGETFTIALPALPVNGRTTYQGYHFVRQQLLSDSPMRNHPLTPMTNPNLITHLSGQTKRRVGLAPYQIVDSGADQLRDCFQQLREQDVGIAITDCLNDSNLDSICRASADLRLITGSSAFGFRMPAVWRERGWLEDRQLKPAEHAITSDGGACLVVAGSCSVATIEQNKWFAQQGKPVFKIDPRDLLKDGFDRPGVISAIRSQLAAGNDCLITTSGSAAEVREVQEWGAEAGFRVSSLGEFIAYTAADLVLDLLYDQTVSGLIVAGGETSGAICRRLELGALRVGRNIEPGVPLCFSLGRFQLPVVLKSGNFGGHDFYEKAISAIEQPSNYLN